MHAYSDTVFRLIAYEIWCNEQAIAFLRSLPDAACKQDFGFGWGSPHRTMFHILDVMRGWSGCVGPVIQKPRWHEYDEGLTFENLAATLSEVGDCWLTAARASHEQGLLAQDGRLEHVFHLVTHGTHHRGQLLSMITLLGHSQPFEGGDFAGWSRTH